MGLLLPELSLDLNHQYVSDTISGFLRDVSLIGDVKYRSEKMDGFIRRLEEEMKKIEVFKRELPFCMLLLEDAIKSLKQELAQYQMKDVHQPVLEEFIPLKKESGDENNQISSNDNDNDDGNLTINNGADGEESSRDKKNWMSSVQLWSADNFPTRIPPSSNQNQAQTLNSESQKGDDKRNKIVGDDLYDINKHRGGSKGFLSMVETYPRFSEFRRKVEEVDVSVPGLSLLLPGIKHPNQDTFSSGLNSRLGISRTTASPASNGQSNVRPGHQQTTARKQRRCWSPELHRRFVDALTQLGGPQVATPKQIRELMRVDGLTNDEVKSHLQKYRLHTRRVPNNLATSTSENCNGLAGSWATLDQQSNSSKPSSSQSRSPEGPLQFPGLAEETSPPLSTDGDSMEEDDDDKSDNYSWKDQVHRPGKDDV